MQPFLPIEAVKKGVRVVVATLLYLGLASVLAGCLTKTLQHGHIIEPETLQEIEVGSSTEQVELLLGTPSTKSTIKGETYYYISQTSEQFAFMDPEIVDQKVVVIYFNSGGRVSNIANYGLQDGKIFDFIDRETVSGGSDYSFINQILRGGANPAIFQ